MSYSSSAGGRGLSFNNWRCFRTYPCTSSRMTSEIRSSLSLAIQTASRHVSSSSRKFRCRMGLGTRRDVIRLRFGGATDVMLPSLLYVTPNVYPSATCIVEPNGYTFTGSDSTKPRQLPTASAGLRGNRVIVKVAAPMSITAVQADRASDLADIGPILCGEHPDSWGSPRHATWQVEYDSVDIHGEPEGQRLHVCDYCLASGIRRAVLANRGITPPVVSPVAAKSVAVA